MVNIGGPSPVKIRSDPDGRAGTCEPPSISNRLRKERWAAVDESCTDESWCIDMHAGSGPSAGVERCTGGQVGDSLHGGGQSEEPGIVRPDPLVQIKGPMTTTQQVIQAPMASPTLGTLGVPRAFLLLRSNLGRPQTRSLSRGSTQQKGRSEVDTSVEGEGLRGNCNRTQLAAVERRAKKIQMRWSRFPLYQWQPNHTAFTPAA